MYNTTFIDITNQIWESRNQSIEEREKNMAKIKNILIDIEYFLQEGLDPEKIAEQLGCPLDWVNQVQHNLLMNYSVHDTGGEW